VKSLDYNSVRRRVLLFYLAAALNLLMGLFVLSAGGSAADRGKLWLIAIIFLAFAGLNYYMARVITKRWDAHVRQQLTGTHANEEVKK
jgi:uncharacterized membrane protein YdjX (TVP38/TMEM64 family)